MAHGTPEQIRHHIGQYVEAGVTTPMIALLPVPGEGPDALAGHIAALAPR